VQQGDFAVGELNVKRALVFDDEIDIRHLFRLLLETRGYEVMTFEDPSEFCQHYCANCPRGTNRRCADMIISDVKMPNLSGIDFMSLILQQGCTVPARALMSGYWTQPVLEGALRMGCQTFAKPMKIDEIFGWLSKSEDRAKLGQIPPIDPSRWDAIKSLSS